MARKCPSCGRENPDGARFCQMCGVAVTSGHQDQQPSDDPVEIYQVGLLTKSGSPIAREGYAITDINIVYPNAKLTFIPYFK